MRIPRGVIIIDFLLNLVLTGGLRMSARFVRESVLITRRKGEGTETLKAVIIGAGDAGEMLIREINRNPKSGFTVQAVFDDDPAKKGRSIHGIRVLGTVEDVKSFTLRKPVDAAIIAIPSANRAQMNRINAVLKELNVSVKTLPPLHEIVAKSPALTQLRDIDITDLLGREEIRIDTEQVYELVHDKVVLVTGAGGSIGSELCRQIFQRSPKKLLLLERSENSLFHVHRKLAALEFRGRLPTLVPLLCDVTDRETLLHLLKKYRPHLVFHSAAHKHVTMQEANAHECFKNNVGGIRALVGACHEAGVDRFLLISTDKAVNPTCVMGATKRICEMYCVAYSRTSRTKFMSVRFGNVLASEGSVVPIFLEQIAAGGPVTVTHPDVKRYFMTIPESVTLVLQAAALGESGQIMILDMGDPIKIVTLARQLINLSGKSHDEVPIEFIGLKPGEKLFEELRCDNEVRIQTAHSKISIYNEDLDACEEVVEKVDRAVETILHGAHDIDVRRIVQEIVPEYQPMNAVSSLDTGKGESESVAGLSYDEISPASGGGSG